MIVAFDEVLIFLSFSLQCFLSSINVGWQVTLGDHNIHSLNNTLGMLCQQVAHSHRAAAMWWPAQGGESPTNSAYEAHLHNRGGVEEIHIPINALDSMCIMHT